MNPKVKDLHNEIEAKNGEVTAFFTALGDEQPTKEQRDRIINLNKEIEAKEHALADLLEVEGIRERGQARGKELKQPVNQLRQPIHDEGRREAKSAGAMFLEDPRVAEYFKQIAPEGQLAKGVRVHTPAVQMKTLITGASDTSGGALVATDRKPILDMGAWMRPLTIRDIVTNGETGSDLVEYVRHGTPTNNAAPVAEATATADGTGSKPESALPLSVVQEAVKTIAHWIPATRRALSDAAQVKTLIDAFLRYGLEEELEDQMLTGTGSGENFTGVLVVSGTTAQAWDTNILTTTRKARTKVRTTGRTTPTAWVMNPTDWETIDLLQDNEARYFFGGPAVLGNPRLWGLPVVESEGMTAGYTCCANWKLAVLWDRMIATILMSDSHSDFFTRNLVAILAEMRAAFGILRPAAFVIADLTA